jgi:hypothetical protein
MCLIRPIARMLFRSTNIARTSRITGKAVRNLYRKVPLVALKVRLHVRQP